MIFLVAAVFMVHLTVPLTRVLMDRRVVTGRIESVHQNALSVSYRNPLDQQTYYLSRNIDSLLEQYLKSRPETIEVAYSKYFPDAATLPAVERDKSVFALVSILVIVTTAFLVIKGELIKLLLQTKRSFTFGPWLLQNSQLGLSHGFNAPATAWKCRITSLFSGIAPA